MLGLISPILKVARRKRSRPRPPRSPEQSRRDRPGVPLAGALASSRNRLECASAQPPCTATASFVRPPLVPPLPPHGGFHGEQVTSDGLSQKKPEYPVSRAERRTGRAAKNDNFVAAFSRWSAAMPQAERLEQVPHRPGPDRTNRRRCEAAHTSGRYRRSICAA
jgi:hypothetical protein